MKRAAFLAALFAATAVHAEYLEIRQTIFGMD
jgi:hypothetical protein